MTPHDRATDVGTAPTTAPVAYWCRSCGEPAYMGAPEDTCDHCGHRREGNQ